MTTGWSDLERSLAALEDVTEHGAGAASTVHDLTRTLRLRVLDQAGARVPRGLPDGEREALLRELVDEVVESESLELSPFERRTLVGQIISDTLGYGPLDALMADPAVTEIMCNGPKAVYVERGGLLEETGLSFADDNHLRTIISRIARATGRRVDESSPMVDARMADGSRMNAVLPPLALNGPVLTIRRFPDDALTPARLIAQGTYTPELLEVLRVCVEARLNIVVSGGTSTGKTTALNLLATYIGARERIITIEDSAELRLPQPHVVSLESRPPNTEGEGMVSIRDLLRNAMRMRPDRLVMGECRGPEALDMLQAMNSGHEGSMTTVHANSPRDALRRLETMVLMAGFELPLRAIREQMSSIVHLVLHLERRPDGRRVVSSLAEVQHMEGDTILLQDLFVIDPGTGLPVATGLRPAFAPALAVRGIDWPTSTGIVDPASIPSGGPT